MSGEYNIQLTSNLTGVNTHSKSMGKKIQVVTPKRSSNGRRVYVDEDTESLVPFSNSVILVTLFLHYNYETEELEQMLEKYGVESNRTITGYISTDLKRQRKTLTHLLMALEGFRLDLFLTNFSII